MYISIFQAVQIIRSPLDFLRFKTKVGDVISSMCKHRRIFWMTRPKVPPRPQLHVIVHGPVHRHPPPQLAPVHRHSTQQLAPVYRHPSPQHVPVHRQPPPQHAPVYRHPPVPVHRHPHPPHRMLGNNPPHHLHVNPPHEVLGGNIPAPVPDRYIVPFKRTLLKESQLDVFAPGDDVADHYVIPPKKQ